VGTNVGGVSENPDKIPEHKRRMCTNVQVKAADDVRGDKGSPKDCSCLKSCESFYTCPHAPFYRETKGLLHSDNTPVPKIFTCRDSRTRPPTYSRISQIPDFMIFLVRSFGSSRVRDFEASRVRVFWIVTCSRLRDFAGSRFQTAVRSRLRDFVN
jgi:hypothetical protein